MSIAGVGRGTVVAVAADRAVDKARVARREVVVAEAEARRHRAGARVLDEHVGGRREPAHERPRPRRSRARSRRCACRGRASGTAPTTRRRRGSRVEPPSGCANGGSRRLGRRRASSTASTSAPIDARKNVDSGPDDEPAHVEHRDARERATSVTSTAGLVAEALAGARTSAPCPLGGAREVVDRRAAPRATSGGRGRPPRGERRIAVEVGRRRAGLHADERARVLAEPRVGRGDDRDLGDAGHAQQQLLDLARADVLAAADDDVLLAVGDREVAVGVEHADVAGREPAVGVERRLRSRAGRCSRRSSRARGSRSRPARPTLDVVAVVVDEAHLDAGQRPRRRCERACRAASSWRGSR